MENTTHKSSIRDFFLYLLAIITLFTCVWSFIALLFEYINEALPDMAASPNGADFYQIRISVSILLIMFPVYLGLTWFLRKDIIKNPEKRQFGGRKFFLNLTLFVAALTLIIDLITLVNRFLEGALTMHFFLKTLSVLVVAGSVLAYYFWDLRRETVPTSKPSKVLAIITAVVVLGGIIGGFFIVGTPSTQRLRVFDQQRVDNLSALSGEIRNYWSMYGKLPTKLNEVGKSFGPGFVLPLTDPVTKKEYEYKVVSRLAFELCAEFDLPTQRWQDAYGNSAPIFYGENWTHEKGHVCFKRAIDPAIYKPIPMKY